MPGDIPDDLIGIWPCCWESYLTFRALETQWNTGPGGPIGLRYEAVPVVLKLRGVPKKEHRTVFADVRHMEMVALRTMEAQRPKPKT